MQVFVKGRDGRLLSLQKFSSAEEAETELLSIGEQLDRWEAHQFELSKANWGKSHPGASPVFVSAFVKLANGGRVLAELIGAMNPSKGVVFMNDHIGELLATSKFEDSEEAERELASLTTQLDCWEVYQAECQRIAAGRKHSRR
jgi:hypothetical protein